MLTYRIYLMFFTHDIDDSTSQQFQSTNVSAYLPRKYIENWLNDCLMLH